MRRMPRVPSLNVIGLTFLAMALLGCGSSGGSLEEERSPKEEAERIHIYDDSDLPAAAYEQIETLTGASCRENVYSDPPGRGEAVSALRQKAGQRGANALVGVTCRRGKSTAECPKALTCTGDAVQVRPVEALPRLAQQAQSTSLGNDSRRVGTGWVLAPGLVVTSSQLVTGRSEYSVAGPDTTLAATLVATDKVHNLALLRPADTSFLPDPLPLAPGATPTGEQVFAAGSPSFGMEATLRTAAGIISGQTGALGDARVYHTTLAPLFEWGGAPLLDYRGRVVGALVPRSSESNFMSSRSGTEGTYAVKVKYLRRLRSRSVESDSMTMVQRRNPLDRKASSLPPLLDRVGPSIFTVIAE